MNEIEELILQIKIMQEESRHIRDYASELSARLMTFEIRLEEMLENEK